MKRILSIMMTFVMMLSFIPMLSSNVYALEDTGNATLNAFINDGRFTDGASWAWNKGPMLASYGSSGCCAYCADYVKYCYGINNPRSGAAFYNVNEIRAGDVLTVGNQSDGTGHWLVCMKRSGNNLYVAEGNVSNRVRIGWNYTISGNKFAQDSRNFTAGYHYLDPFDPTPSTPQGSPIGGGRQTVSDGDYHIVSALNPNMGVDVCGNGNAEGTNVQLYENTTDTKQVFNVKYLGDGFYRITHKSSGKVLDVYGASRDYGTNVSIYGSNNTDAQKWRIDVSGDSKYLIIKAKCNGLCLDVNGGNVANGANIQVWGSNGSNAQNWKFIAVPGKKTVADGDYHIVSALNNNMGIDVYGNSSAEGTNVQLYKNITDPKQVFTVKYLGDGYYQLRHKSSGKVLDMYGNNSAPFTNVSIYGFNNTDAQKWIIKSVGNGYFTIIGKGSGLALDVYSGEAKNGANISGYITNNTNAQKWGFIHAHSLIKVSAKAATTTATGNIEYWTCRGCGKCFKDSAGKTEIKKSDTITAKKKSAAATPKLYLSRKAYTWNNKVQTPKIAVKAGSKTLPASCYKVTLPKGRKNVGKYTIKVTLKNGYSGTRSASYTIKPKGTGLTGVTAASKAATVKWAKQTAKMSTARITGYQIQYSMKKDFKSGNKAVNVGGYTKTSRKITGLASKKTYYFRVRTYLKSGSKTYYSGWSKARAVKVK